MSESSSPEVDSPDAGQTAAGLRRDLLRRLAAVDRRLRLRRALRALVWLVPACCLWLLSAWLLRTAASDDGNAAALWPSWAGGMVLLALGLREAFSLARDLPAAARAVDRVGDLRDTVATALEMQQRLGTDAGERHDPKSMPTTAASASRWTDGAPTDLPLPWIMLVLERGVAGLDRIGPRQAAPGLAPRGAMLSAFVSALLLAPIALPNSLVGEALAAAMSSDDAEADARSLEAAALLEKEPGQRPGVPEFDVRLSDLPFLSLRIREPDDDADSRRGGDAAEGAEGSLGDDLEAEGNREGSDATKAADGGFAGEATAETGADLMRELDTGNGDQEAEAGAAGSPGESEGAEAEAEPAASGGEGGQPTEDGEGSSSESGTAAAVSEEPGTSSAEADGSAAGVGTGPQDEMVDPFGDLLAPALSLEQALEHALLESRDEIERRPLATTSATRFRAAEVARRGTDASAAGGGADAAASSGELPPARRPIAWRHRASVRRYLESLENDAREDSE